MGFLVIYMFNLMNYISRSLSNGNKSNIAICNLEIRKTYLRKSTILLNMYSIRITRKGEIATDEYS